MTGRTWSHAAQGEAGTHCGVSLGLLVNRLVQIILVPSAEAPNGLNAATK